jgi:N-acetyl-anhydromuramyl-L-alanine amidase AmpD
VIPNLVYQTASAKRVTWHAKGYNSTSIGIELLVEGEHDYWSFLEAIAKPDWVSLRQYFALKDLLIDQCELYSIEASNILGHVEVDPARKKDPGSLDMSKLRKSIKMELDGGLQCFS